MLAALQAGAQDVPHAGHDPAPAPGSSKARIELGASAIGVGTVAVPGVHDRTLAEGYLTQPMLMAQLSSARGKLIANLTLNFEGITLDRGELNAGMYGEGYVDRRHPHTLFHEVTVTSSFGGGYSRFSVTTGKGFIPYGTDDPMSRPFVKYPVNHHLAQLLERAMVQAAVRSGPLSLEVAAFNGDEPHSPYDGPALDRVGDSWSARLTGYVRGFEAQASVAHVTSPEQPAGGGLDHRKVSGSVRYESRNRYLLAEWARSRELDGSRTAFVFNSMLAEASLTRNRVNVAIRAERTERPEEERLVNVFRTPRPASDLSIHGRTRWDVVSAAVSRNYVKRRIGSFAPFLEIATQRPRAIVRPTPFEPRDFYGADRLWSFSGGIRLGFGMRHSRMGKYGAAVSHNREQGGDHSTMDME